MNNEQMISGFHIEECGDQSVGISAAFFELKGSFYFVDEEHLQEFKTELKELFENHQADTRINVYTFEELDQMNQDCDFDEYATDFNYHNFKKNYK